MNDPSRLQELFHLYRQRRCTAAEVEELIRLLQDADAEESLSGPMLDCWHQLRDHAAEYPVNWDAMYSRISQSEEELYTLHQRRKPSYRVIYAIAAIMVLALLIPAAWWMMTGRTRPVEVKDNGQMKLARSTAPSLPSELAKRRVLHLPDGSTVTLNKNSRLDYTPGFAGVAREVYLTGEAFFDIVRAPGKPFLVHTGKVTTRVLGTSFNIRAYPGDKAIEITVAHGKVQVTEEKMNRGLLTDAQQLRLEANKDQYSFRKVDVDSVIAWRPKEIHFDDITLGEVAKQVKTRFGRTVHFTNTVLENCRVTASFFEDDGLEEIMTVICGISQSTYVIQDDVITVDGNGCN